MSDVDDRMERAERIRKMRQSREHDVADEDRAAGSDDSDTTDGSEAERADRAAERAGFDGDTEDTGESDGETNSGRSEPETDVEPDRGEPDRADADAVEEQEPEGSGAADVEAHEAQGRSTTETATGAVEQHSTTATAGADAESIPTTGGGIAPLGSAAGVSLSDAVDDSEAGEDGEPIDGGERAAGTRAGATTAAVADASVRVLEFTVGEQTYCIDIDRVEEIVKRETVTRVPNTPSYVEGVVDLRGQITTILDTKRLLSVEAGGREELLVIFAPDAFEEHGSVGWVVDEVRQVIPVPDDQVRTAPGDEEHVRGIVDREDEDDLVVWIQPGVAMTRAVEGDVGEAAVEE